ncbi:MAG: hypothetical protein KTR16_04250 [Acidiferrobacterales bacterium]|nr:hypothetical protein [Acidiferrobacterales bacterium]
MDKPITLKQVLSITFIVILLNNIALWFLLKDRAPAGTTSIANTENAPLVQTKNSFSDEFEDAFGAVAHQDTLPEVDAPDRINDAQLKEELAITFNEYIASEEFKTLLDSRQAERAQLYRDQLASYNSMTSLELIATYQMETNETKKLNIQHALTQKNLSIVNTADIKQILFESSVSSHIKSTLIHELLERGDYEALDLAKLFLTENIENFGYGEAYETMKKVFELDRDFVIDLGKSLSLEQFSTSAILMIFQQDPSAIKAIFQTKLDDILDAENPVIFENFAYSTAPIELSREQQNTIADLMFSKRSAERNFALTMSHSIEDIDLLRTRFETLETETDKQSFIFGLMKNSDSKPHQELLGEFSGSLNDPYMNLLLKLDAD